MVGRAGLGESRKSGKEQEVRGTDKQRWGGGREGGKVSVCGGSSQGHGKKSKWYNHG